MRESCSKHLLYKTLLSHWRPYSPHKHYFLVVLRFFSLNFTKLAFSSSSSLTRYTKSALEKSYRARLFIWNLQPTHSPTYINTNSYLKNVCCGYRLANVWIHRHALVFFLSQILLWLTDLNNISSYIGECRAQPNAGV